MKKGLFYETPCIYLHVQCTLRCVRLPCKSNARNWWHRSAVRHHWRCCRAITVLPTVITRTKTQSACTRPETEVPVSASDAGAGSVQAVRSAPGNSTTDLPPPRYYEDSSIHFCRLRGTLQYILHIDLPAILLHSYWLTTTKSNPYC